MRSNRILLSMILVTASGCRSMVPHAGPDPGVTGYAFAMGCAVQRYSFAEPLVERALIEALNDLGVHDVNRTREDDRVSLCGALYDSRILKVSLDDREGSTIVRIRVDYYGDEPFSKILIDRTSARLSTMPPELIPPNDPRTFSDSVTHRGQNLAGYRGIPLR